MTRGLLKYLIIAMFFSMLNLLGGQPCVAQRNIDGASKISPMTLSVEDAVMQALQHNDEFALVKMQPLIAGAFVQLERGQYNPELFAEASHLRANTTRVYPSTGEKRDVTEKQVNIEAGIEQRTPLGTAIQVSVSSQKADSSRARTQHGARIGLSITQQLLQGMGPTVNLARIHKAKLETRISEQEFAAFGETLVAEVEMAYWYYVNAQNSVNVVLKSMVASQAKLADVKERIAVGDAPENDAAAAAAEAGMREKKLLEAKRIQTECKLALMLLIAPNTRSPLSLEIVTNNPFQQPMKMEGVVADHVKLALVSRTELKEARLRRRQGKLDVAVTRNGVLPKLELFIELGKTGYAESFAKSISSLNESTYDAQFGIRFRHVLGNRQAKARRTIASVNMATYEQSINNLQRLISYDVYNAWNNLENAREMLRVTQQTHLNRGKAVDSVMTQYEVGTATRLEVVQAERDLLESGLEQVNAQVQYQIARVQFYKAEGTLLARRGIVME